MRARREPGPLQLSRDVRASLLRLLAYERAVAAGEGEPTPLDPAPMLSLEAVQTLEDHLRARVVDDVLSLFAVRARALSGLELGRVGSLSEQAWQLGLSKARIVLGERGGRWPCVPRRPDRGFAVRVTFFDPAARTEGDASTLAAWLDRLAEENVERLALEEDGWEAIERDLEGLALAPRVERTIAPAPGPRGPARRVRHRRFGIGVVLRELPGGGKLEIDFGPAGVRVLVAEYVEDLADA